MPSSTRNTNMPALSATDEIRPTFITLSMVVVNLKPADKIAPDKMPMNSELNTSFVIRAKPIAITGGSNAQSEPTTLPAPPHVSHSLPSISPLAPQSGHFTVFLTVPVATATIKSVKMTTDAIIRVTSLLLLKHFFTLNIFVLLNN